jgi:hypothetical protein
MDVLLADHMKTHRLIIYRSALFHFLQACRRIFVNAHPRLLGSAADEL